MFIPDLIWHFISSVRRRKYKSLSLEQIDTFDNMLKHGDGASWYFVLYRKFRGQIQFWIWIWIWILSYSEGWRPGELIGADEDAELMRNVTASDEMQQDAFVDWCYDVISSASPLPLPPDCTCHDAVESADELMSFTLPSDEMSPHHQHRCDVNIKDASGGRVWSGAHHLIACWLKENLALYWESM